ncbi:MAG: ATP-binding protein, partial [Blastocatellia bacterium]
PTGGRLTIETENVEFDMSIANPPTVLAPGKYVMLADSDNGCGMDEKVQAHIFEPFFTTKEKGKGTGLGLATVHGIVKQTGGHISVESTRDVGTTFRIFFPSTESRDPSSNSTGSRISATSASQTGPAATQSATPRSADHVGEKKSVSQPGGEHLGGFNRNSPDRNDIHIMLADVLMSRDYGDTQEHAEGPRSFKL